MPRISLKLAFAVAFTLVAAIPVWLAMVWPQEQAFELEMAAVRDRQETYALSLASALKRYYRDIEATFLFYELNFDAMTQLDAEANIQLLSEMGFRHICRFEIATGALLKSVGMPGRDCPEVAPQPKLDLFTALSVEGAVTASGAEMGPDGKPLLFLMKRKGETVTIGAVPTDYFRELGATVDFGDNGHAAIVDQHGRALWHPNAQVRDGARDLSALSVVQAMLRGETGFTTFYSPVREQDMIAGYAPVDGIGWGVMVPQPKDDVYAQVGKLRTLTRAIMLAGLAAAVLLALVIAHVLLDPLRRIRVGAERFGNGFGDALIPPQGAGRYLAEINDLRTAFNAMVLRVRNAQRMESEARREAQEASRVKSRFLANMSHELRTPLNAIIGFSDVTQRRLKDGRHERETEYLGHIHDAGKHLLTLINDLLDLSRIEAGVHELREEEVDIGAMLGEVGGLLSPVADEKSIELAWSRSADALLIRADAAALKQILLNLVSNAIRYSNDGDRVSMTASRMADGRVLLGVEDTGPGIPAEDLMTVRKPFRRARQRPHDGAGSTGLGLSIVDALARLHGASFELASTEGVGTTARVVFPAERAVDPVGVARRVAPLRRGRNGRAEAG